MARKLNKLQKIGALVLAVVVICVSFSGCMGKQSSKTLYEKVVNTLKNMDSFVAKAYVRFESNNKSNTYLTIQKAKTSGEYRIEVTSPENAAGNITIFDGKVIAQFNTKIAGKISVGTTEALERSEILLTSFVRNYLISEEVSVGVSKTDSSDETVLEATIPGDHKYLATEKLWIDNKTLKPVELIIYDKDGIARILVSYHEFEYNIQLDDSEFMIQG